MRLLLAALLALSCFADDLATIHVVPGSHLDIGFTDTPSAVRAKRIGVLDDAIAAAQADPGFHWHEESAWVVHQWRRERPEKVAVLKELLKEGRVSIGAAWCNPHAAAFSEHLDLLFFHLDDFERDLGVRPAAATLNDVPSYPVALVDACARAKVRYLLVGANMAFTSPLPKHLAKAPFWWEAPSGNRVLVFIDDDSYTAAYTKWGIDPDCARFFNEKEFPRDQGPMETMEAGIRRMMKSVNYARDAIVVQHAFDNWDAGGAKKLPRFAKEWNASRDPKVVVGSPEAFFRHIEQKYGKNLPVQRGEWGGQWDSLRGSCPLWTWRLREAMKALPADAPFDRKADLATSMEHSQGLGPGWGGMFTREQTVAHAREVAELFTRACGPDGAKALPAIGPLPMCDEDCKDVWRAYLAQIAPRVRCGRGWLGPFTFRDSPEIKSEHSYGIDSTRYGARVHVNRAKLPGSDAGSVSCVVEIALRAPRKSLSLAPEESHGAGWLRGEAPAFVVAPGGVRVKGLVTDLRVTAPLVFSWCLEADKDKPDVTWLQGLITGQSFQCGLKGGATEVLAFEELYPGEPAGITIDVLFEVVPP